MNRRTVAFVFARGGSKGLPGKNLRPVGGVPLVGHSIRVAQASRFIERIVVSTDSAEIASVARQFGAVTPGLRPAELASDEASEWEAWRHAVRRELLEAGPPMDIFVSVPPTAPLRSVQDVDACIDLFLEGGADAVVTVRPAERNPWFNMVTLDDDRSVQLVNTGDGAVRRQDAPVVWDLTTVAYVTTPSYILTMDGLFSGTVRAVAVPKERAVDIDDEIDLALAELLHARDVRAPG